MSRELKTRLVESGQEHLLAFWDELDPSQRIGLADQIEAIDFSLIQRLVREGAAHEDWAALAARATRPPAIRLNDPENRVSPEQARRAGEAALRAGQVGTLLVAGGQGTRLGFDHPKGMYPIGPVSEASLFQIHFEKILAARRPYDTAIPIYLMTSPATHNETAEFLSQHDWFGFPPDDVVLFCQGSMPAVDASTGALLLADRGELFLSPDGHGGVLEALERNGVIRDMVRRGLEQIFYFQVDNPLAPVADEQFMGCHLLAESELSTLVVAKESPDDRLGNVVSVDGKVCIIEYIDLPEQAAVRCDDRGDLMFWAGSTAIHVFEVPFLQRMSEQGEALPFHVSKKKVPYLDAQGRRHSPEAPNAFKFERFVFDLLPAAERSLVVEADRKATFGPLKNASGEAQDTPESVRAQMVDLHRCWLEAAGVQVAPEVAVEISPLFASGPEAVVQRFEPGATVSRTTYFSV